MLSNLFLEFLEGIAAFIRFPKQEFHSFLRCVTNCEKRKIFSIENLYVNVGSSFKLGTFIGNRVLGLSYNYKYVDFSILQIYN